MSNLRGAIVPVTPFQQNCAILWDEDTKRGLIIDPGGDVEQLLGAIDQLDVTIERVLLTHGHMDHAGGTMGLVAGLRDKGLTVPIDGPDRRDQFLLDIIADQAARYGFQAENVVPDRWLREGDVIELVGHRFEVLHCPGHTPGHVVFINQAARFAILGDVLFQGSVGRTDFEYGDHDALIGAIKHKLLPLGDDYSFLCGHGPGSSFGQERRTNPFLR